MDLDAGSVDLRALDDGPVLARGGLGEVRAVGDGDDGKHVLKSFHAPDAVDRDALKGMIDWRRALSNAERQRLDRVTTWPLASVHDGGQLVGYVMRRVPRSFELSVKLPSGRRRTVLREAQYLFAGSEQVSRMRMPEVEVGVRRRIIWELAEVLGFLHARGVIIGDLSARNVLWAPEVGEVLLLDCDSMQVIGLGSPHPVVETVDWDDPGRATPSRQSDVYKTALFVLRTLTRSFQSRDPREADLHLDGAGRGLLHASLSREPTARPSADAWERWAVGRRAAAVVID